MKEYLKKLGNEREDFFFHNILKNEYENIIWCKNYNIFLDYKLKIDFIGVKKNDWTNDKEIVFIQIGSSKKNFLVCKTEAKINIKENKKIKNFIYNFLLKEKIINFNQNYLIYYRFYTLFKNWNLNKEILVKDYKIFLDKVKLINKKNQ